LAVSRFVAGGGLPRDVRMVLAGNGIPPLSCAGGIATPAVKEFP
jgi:hypothetical protein